MRCGIVHLALLACPATGFAPSHALRPECVACARLAPRTTVPRLWVTHETVDECSASPLTGEQEEAKMEGAARTLRLNSIAAINAFVIGSFGLAIAYNLLHVDLQAIAALYQYPSGEVEEGFSKLAASLDLLARLPMDQIHSYEILVPTNPIFYKACTSGVAYTFGDFISQVYQGRNLGEVDLPRSFRSGMAGFIGHGPLCHFWMLCMERYLDFNGAWWATGVKVVADQTVWSLYLNAMYSFFIGALAFRKPEDVWRDIKLTSWPALRSSWRFWPFVHLISFSHAVPLDLKLLWVDVMEIVWVTILSRVANQDKEAREASGEEAVAVVGESFGVNPATEIIFTQELEQGNDPLAGSGDEFDTPKAKLRAALDGAGSATDPFLRGLSDTVSAFDPRKVPPPPQLLANAWPLVAMWPILLVVTQIERSLGVNL
mmetsp:Transcript_22101/g.69439  ORF Transcript_22101/g.69439 Transcript_22101/m.69439 type:complete len:431 (+) Transcript_22101:1-1293(+)